MPSSLNEDASLFIVKSIYLGSEPMGELLEGENGSDVIQVPLKRTILRTNGSGKETDLEITNDSLVANFTKLGTSLKIPIELLAYCGALRQLPPHLITKREFETLDKSPTTSIKNSSPPLFVTIFRSLENENTLYCHSFVIKNDEDAMELVKLVMEVYYNLIRLNNNESVDRNDSIDNELEHKEELNKNLKDRSKSNSPVSIDYDRNYDNYKSSDELNKIINSFVKETEQTYSTKDKTNITAKEFIDQAVTESKELSQLDKFDNVPLNDDDDPIIIKKENKEKLVYKQNVFIRWLQPPTPPPAAPIIIREVQEPEPDPLPPLVIYKQAPRPLTPPPLIIRERPPSPLDLPKEPLIIERRVSIPERHRRVIIEHLPPPPPKPRDIILEKWLPREPSSRQIVVQKAKELTYQKPIYEVIDNYNNRNSDKNNREARRDLYEVLNTPIPSMRKKKSISNRPCYTKRSTSNESYLNRNYSPENDHSPVNQLYSSPKVKQHKLAGYRIIRQIIPGPTSTPTDIEKAIARSKKVSCKVYSNQRFYSSPMFDSNSSGYNNSNCYINHHRHQQPRYHHSNSHNQLRNFNHIYSSTTASSTKLNNNIYGLNGSGCYSILNYGPQIRPPTPSLPAHHLQSYPITRKQVCVEFYQPHNTFYNNGSFEQFLRRNACRSTSIDRF